MWLSMPHMSIGLSEDSLSLLFHDRSDNTWNLPEWDELPCSMPIWDLIKSIFCLFSHINKDYWDLKLWIKSLAYLIFILDYPLWSFTKLKHNLDNIASPNNYGDRGDIYLVCDNSLYKSMEQVFQSWVNDNDLILTLNHPLSIKRVLRASNFW